jgi:uncharacterized protein (TIGR00255 family)
MTTVPALKSMTGYAQARVEENGWTLRLSLRSVNHRFLDLHLRLPEGFEPLEPGIRQVIRERIRRGHLDVTLHFEPAGPAAVEVNREIASAYLKAAEELRQKFQMKSEPDLAAILRLPGVIAPPIASIEDNLERLGELVSACLKEALERLDLMRQSEGRVLSVELSKRLKSITEHVTVIEGLAQKVRPAYMKRLEARLKELLHESQLDPARLAQEAAMAAERSDVSEELSRLRSHVLHFEAMLTGAAEAGKKLDFLLQEMQRESNTLLSKTPGTEAEGMAMTELGLEVKSEIEKLREQIQNVE